MWNAALLASTDNWAHTFNNCANTHREWHVGSVVAVSLRDGFIYVDNHKAGSTTVRAALVPTFETLVDPEYRRLGQNESQIARGQEHRVRLPVTKSDAPRDRKCLDEFVTSDCLANKPRGSFVFSFTREPVSKFNSAVQQIQRYPDSTGARFRKMSADEILIEQTQAYMKARHQAKREGWLDHYDRTKSPWIEQHLAPSTYLLSGRFGDGSLMQLSYLGHIETMGDPTTGPSFLAAAPSKSRASLASIFTQEAVNTKGNRTILAVAEANIKHSGSLSLAGLLRMCHSLAYRDEWTCNGYDMPAICTASTSQRAGQALKHAAAVWMHYLANKSNSTRVAAIEAERRATDEVAHAVVRYIGAADDPEIAVRAIV